MNARRHRLRLSRRQPKPIPSDRLERMLSHPPESTDVSGSFEERVLGRVGSRRPFVSRRDRRRVRWVRMSLIGLVLGLFSAGVLGIRAGLLPFGEGAGPVSFVVQTAQLESVQQVQSVSLLRDEALAMFESIRQRQQQAQRQAPARCDEAWAVVSAQPRPATERGVCVGLSMREPVSAFGLSSTRMNTRFVVFDDGLALPIAGSGGPSPVQIKRWPSNVQDSIMSLGLEGSSAHAPRSTLPPWYGSDAVRRPERTRIDHSPDVPTR